MLRDKYIIPAMAEATVTDTIESLIHSLRKSSDKVQDYINQFHAELGGGQVYTVSEVFELFKENKKRSKSPETTIINYAGSQELFNRLGFGSLKVNEVTKKHVSSVRDTLLELPSKWMKYKDPLSIPKGSVQTTSVSTVNTHLTRLRTVFKWGMDEGKIILQKNPTLGIRADDRKVKKTKRQITVEECDALMNMPSPKSKKYNQVTWKYMPLIARYTGARLGEIAQLTIDDFQMIEGFFCISINDYENEGVEKSLKTEQSCRIVPVSDKLRPHIDELLKYIPPGQKLLFPKRGDHKNSIAHHFTSAFCIKAKEVGSHCTFHRLRSYAITQMRNNGIEDIDRKRITGHKDNSTHGGYTSDNIASYKRAVDTIA
ncbi:MAG: tyrosine-type recombinase/integrase [Lentisphaeraceae bacterium]|nr:tyrosine-type recombinase/integrase [Lentisphaeraceae bacterium]